MDAVKVVKDGMTRTYWFEEPVFACAHTWANLNVPFNKLRCEHRICQVRVARLLRVNGVFYVGAGSLNERALFITLVKGADWDAVEPEVIGIIETFEPAVLDQ